MEPVSCSAGGDRSARTGLECQWERFVSPHFPPLPSVLCPVSLIAQDQGCLLRLVNPGPSRVHWCPGDGWRMRRRDEDNLLDAVTFAPGELAELLITQSS